MPVASVTGSRMISSEIGQRKYGGTSTDGPSIAIACCKIQEEARSREIAREMDVVESGRS